LRSHGATPLSSGKQGGELVQILEASSESLPRGGGPGGFALPEGEQLFHKEVRHNGNGNGNGTAMER